MNLWLPSVLCTKKTRSLMANLFLIWLISWLQVEGHAVICVILILFTVFTMLCTGYVFEEIVIGSKTIRLSRWCSLNLLLGVLIWSFTAATICFFLFFFRWPFTRLFADPAKFGQVKSSTEKDISPSLAGEAMSND